jgi:endonuclease/exonuclease/phosphatase family metal-dependent hydrolase
MAGMRLCSFNVNNLFVRYRFGEVFPGAPAVVDPGAEDPGAPRGYQRWGFLPAYEPDSFEVFNPVQRQLSAVAMEGQVGQLPDVVVLQEVESLIAIRTFNERHLRNEYPYALVIDSRDVRQIDVAVLSRLEILDIRTHVDDRIQESDATEPSLVFSRDCLDIELALTRRERLTLFVNHFKSKFVDPKKLVGLSGAARQAMIESELRRSAEQRARQARRTIEIVRQRFPGQRFDRSRFVVVGDLNDHAGSAPLEPLFAGSGLEDALARLPAEERWTHYFKSQGTGAQIDAMLLSPRLAADTAGQLPEIERRGLEFREVGATSPILPRQLKIERRDDDPDPLRVDFTFERFPGVAPGVKASDHCALFLEL